MLVNISDIQIKDRIRKDYGDIDGLAESIQKNGLIQPIVITPDNVLIAGERRIKAALKLGWTTIEAMVMQIEDYEHLLHCEIEENEQRKDFTPEEKVHYTNELLQIEKIKAEKRKKATQFGNLVPLHGTEPENKDKGEAKEIAAKKVGFSRASYDRAKAVIDSGNREVIDLMNKGEKNGGLSIRGAYERVMESKKKEDKPVKQPDKQKTEETEVKEKSESWHDSEEVKQAFLSIINIPYFEESVNRFLADISNYQFCSESFKLLSETEQVRLYRNVMEVESWVNGMKKAFKEAGFNGKYVVEF